MDDGTITLLPNPVTKLTDVTLLLDMDFIKKIGEDDYWYYYFGKYDLNQKVHFPYSFYLIKALPFYFNRFYEYRLKNSSHYKKIERLLEEEKK